MSRTITWLHLSDLHACRPKSGWDAKRVLDTLRTDLHRLNRDEGLRPDLIFFTGDAAFGHIGNQRGEAISDQFREADDFLNSVRESFNPLVPKRNLFLVPGNHDVNREKITRMDSKWLEEIRSLEEIEQIIRDAKGDWQQLLGRLLDYKNFLETYDYDHLLSGHDRLIYGDMREIGGLKIGIGGFNSSWSSRGAGREECGKLWMAGRFQLETILSVLPQHDFSIALIHHPGNWLVPEENPKFFRQLERDFHFVLHGHEHQDFVRADASSGHTVLSAGACHEWSTGKNNGYSFVRLYLDSCQGEVWLREYEDAGGGWRPRVITHKTDDKGRWPLKHLQSWLRRVREKSEPADTITKSSMPLELVIADDPALDYELRYRKAVADKLDYIQLFGIDVPSEAAEYSLSVAYVSLNMADEFAEEERDNGEKARPEKVTPEKCDDAIDDSKNFVDTTLPAEDFFNKLSGDARRLLIRGVAGCGKTTLLRWAAVQAGKYKKSVGSDGGWRTLVPFIIRLRDFPDGELPRPRDYPLRLAKELPDAPSGWMDRILDDGRALLMFDGADELPSTIRRKVLGEIRQLMTTYPRNAFVVTTRPEAVERAEFRELGFVSARVEAMSSPDRSTFIDRWHEAMEVRLRNRDESQDLRPIAARLKERLDETPAIARLTVIPLLCAVVCALHLKRKENLPETPVDLCEKLTEMLLVRRDKERIGRFRDRTEEEQYAELDYAKRKGLLSRLAHYMVLKGISAVTEADADQQIIVGLKSYNLAGFRVEQIRQSLIERSGMLQESSEQRIEFLHNTLKEFLAAERFVNSGDVQFMADNCHEESWQPVILFALALPREGSNFATELLKAILKKTPTDGRAKGRKKADKKISASLRAKQFFFFRCCTTANQFDDTDVRTCFQRLSAELLPPRTLTDAEALAGCGEAVVPYLQLKEMWGAQTRAACVRTLGIIGGARATRQLQAYRRDDRIVLNTEWRRLLLESPKLFSIVNPEVRELNLYNTKIVDLAPLAILTNLQYLFLHATQVTDLSPLANISSLRYIHLGNTHIHDLSALESLTLLRELILRSTPVSDLAPIAKLTGLERLDLNSTMVSDISCLCELTGLKTLILHGTPVTEVTSLARLTGLERVDLDNTEATDVSSLAGLTDLTVLSICNTQVSDVSPLAGLTKIRELNINHTPISDLSPLVSLNNLRTLDISSTQVSDVSPLKGLTELRELNINNTQVSDVSPLASLTNLRELSINNTRISDVSPLASLTNLRKLSLSSTQVTDVSSLASLTSLSNLDLKNTPVKNLSSLANLTRLEYLDLDNTEVSDVSFLVNLTKLRELGLNNTQVADVSALAEITSLYFLELDNTQVSDVSKLTTLTGLRILSLRSTLVMDVSPLVSLVSNGLTIWVH